MFHSQPNYADEFIIGESNLATQADRLLKLPYLAILVCLEGKAVVQVNLKNHLLQSHNLLVLSEDSLTRFLRTSKDFRLAYYLVDKHLASEIAYKLPNRLFAYLWHVPHYILNEEEKCLLRSWMFQIQSICQTGRTYRHAMLCNHLQTFFLYLAELLQDRLSDEFPSRTYSRKEQLCWRFWDLIGKHCKAHRDVAFYAQELYVTPFYLSQLTKNFMNDSPKGLIERQVILEIESLLDTSELSVKQIADLLHFEDASYMCRFFKRHTGISLTAYRKRRK